jgi:hypothetical protein
MTKRFVFVSNIKDPLAEKLNPFPELMEAYLLSETYSTPKSVELAGKAQAFGHLIVSDNGNFSRIKLIAAQYYEKAAIIVGKSQNELTANGRISDEMLKARLDLVLDIQNAVTLETAKLNINKIISTQLKCKPEYLIAMEDFNIPVLHLVGLLDPIFPPILDLIKSFQQNTTDVYLKEQKGDYGFKDELAKILKFSVYHSHDYKSARQASTLNKKHNIEGIAISLGAPLASRNYIPNLFIANKLYTFQEKLPEAYLLSIAQIFGVIGGDKRNQPIHILGLGSPILIILVSLLLRKSKAISIDSTATFKDADDGTIYGSRSAYLKMDMYKVAAYALLNNEPYTSSSPWFGWFDRQFPADWVTLKQQLDIKPTDDITIITQKLLANPPLMEKYIPFFSPMRAGGDEHIKKARIARAGTNFWALRQICEEVRKRIDSKSKLYEWVEFEVKRYEQVASPKWKIVVRNCFEMIKTHSK